MKWVREIILLTYLLGHGGAFIIKMTSTQGILLKSTELDCLVQLEGTEEIMHLLIEDMDNGVFYSWKVSGEQWTAEKGEIRDPRISFYIWMPTLTSYQLKFQIVQLECSDQRGYTCHLIWRDPVKIGVNNTFDNYSNTNLVLRAYPTTPVLDMTVPQSFRSCMYSFEKCVILETTQVILGFKLKVGSPGRGNVTWRLWHGSRVETLPHGDPRISQRPDPINDVDSKCSERVYCQISVNVTRIHQNLAIGIFVTNVDFNISLPKDCLDTSLEYCFKTSRFEVHYPITEADMTVTRSSRDSVVVGEAVNFTCSAEVYPAASLRWAFSPGHEAKAPPRSLGDGPVYTLEEAEVDHSGEYRCIASNIVEGRTHEAYKSVLLTVELNDHKPLLALIPLLLIPPTWILFCLFLKWKKKIAREGNGDS